MSFWAAAVPHLGDLGLLRSLLHSAAFRFVIVASASGRVAMGICFGGVLRRDREAFSGMFRPGVLYKEGEDCCNAPEVPKV